MQRVGEAKGGARPLLYVHFRWLWVGGLALFLFLAPFSRGLFFDADAVPFQMALGLLLGIFTLDCLNRRAAPTLGPAWGAFPLALPLAYALPLLVGPADGRVALEGALRVLAAAAAFFLASAAGRGRAAARVVPAAVYGSAVGVTLLGFAGQGGFLPLPEAAPGEPMTSTLQYHNAFAALALVGFLLGVGWRASSLAGRAGRPGRPRPDGGAAASPDAVSLLQAGQVVLLLGILGSESRGVWVVLPLAALALLLGLPWRWAAAAAGRTAFAVAVALLATRPIFHAFAQHAGRSAWAELGGAAAAAVVLDAAYGYAERWWASASFAQDFRRVLQVLGVVYVGLVLLIYVRYTLSVLPSAYAAVLTPSQTARLESVVLTDPSFRDRLTMTRDSLVLLVRHPLGLGAGGWNAFYHTVQRKLYWSSETHDGFAQAAVEAGVPGLALDLAFWGSVAGAALRLRRRFRRDATASALPWGAAVAALALAVHSAFDFDFSYPGLLAIAWALAGCVHGAGYGETDAASQAPAPASPAWRPAAIAGLVLVVGAGAILYFPSAHLERAGLLGAAASRAALQGQAERAAALYREAARLDPRNGGFALDLGDVLISQGRARDDVRLVQQGADLVWHALALEPYNLPLRLRAVELLKLGRKWSAAADAAEETVRLVPLDPRVYEMQAQADVVAAAGSLEQGDFPAARRFAAKALQVKGRLAQRRLAPTAVTPLAAAQAAYILGRWDEAAAALRPLAADQAPYRAEAQVWLAAALEHLGQPDEARRVLQQAEAQSPGWGAEYARVVKLVLPPGR